jgi:hypothetical protein
MCDKTHMIGMRRRLRNGFNTGAVFARGSTVQQSTETLPGLRCLRQTLKQNETAHIIRQEYTNSKTWPILLKYTSLRLTWN